MKTVKNQYGLTLVEMLSVVIIGGIVSLIAFNVLFTMLKNEDRVAINAHLRDEADYYISTLTRTIYTLNESNVCQNLKDINEGYPYMITSENCDDPNKKKYKTGLDLVDSKLELYVEAELNNKLEPIVGPISGKNKAIILSNSSYIKKEKENIYNISLTLLYNNHSKTFKSEVHSILN